MTAPAVRQIFVVIATPRHADLVLPEAFSPGN
jgi:hypothetical protein